LTPWGSEKVVKPLGKLEDREELTVAMAGRGRSDEKIRKVLGENWLRYLGKIWGEEESSKI
jgi:membrane dipeptidase